MLNRIIRQISVKDAAGAMGILLKRDDIAARQVDDQFLVTAYHPVEPKKFFLFRLDANNYQFPEPYDVERCRAGENGMCNKRIVTWTFCVDRTFAI